MIKTAIVWIAGLSLAIASPHPQASDLCPISAILPGPLADAPCGQITINNDGCTVQVQYASDLTKKSFTFTGASATFRAQRGAKLQLDAQPQSGRSAAEWTGTDCTSNPTTFKVPLTGKASLSVTCPQQCIPTGGICDITDPGACCSFTCGVVDYDEYYHCW